MSRLSARRRWGLPWRLGFVLLFAPRAWAESALPWAIFHEEHVGRTFALSSIQYSLDGREIFNAKGEAVHAAQRELAMRSVSPGLHGLTAQLVYVGNSPMFTYLQQYRLYLTVRATVQLHEGEALEVKTTVTEKNDPTLPWESRLKLQLDGKPRKALIDVQILPNRKEPVDDAHPETGVLSVTPEEQARDEAKAQAAIDDLLKQVDATEKTPTALALQDAPPCSGADLRFGFARVDIAEKARPTLRAFVACVRRHAGWRVRIEGHCDRRGPKDYNRQLGQRRANAVLHFMRQEGLSSQALEAVSYGFERPLCEEDTLSCHTQNRRVELAVSRK